MQGRGVGAEGPLGFLGGAGRARWLVGPLLWNNGVGFPAMNEAEGGGEMGGGAVGLVVKRTSPQPGSHTML